MMMVRWSGSSLRTPNVPRVKSAAHRQAVPYARRGRNLMAASKAATSAGLVCVKTGRAGPGRSRSTKPPVDASSRMTTARAARSAAGVPANTRTLISIATASARARCSNSLSNQVRQVTNPGSTAIARL